MVAAFLHHQSWQTKFANLAAKKPKALSRHAHLRLRIFLVNVKAQGKIQGTRVEVSYRASGFLQSRKKRRFIRSMRHGQIQVKTSPSAHPLFVTESSHYWIKIRRIPVYRNIGYIGPVIENFLDSLTVMHIGIQNKNTLVFPAQCLGCDSGIVQVTESACRLLTGVMAGRTA